MAVRGGRIYRAFDFAASARCWKIDVALSSEIAASEGRLHHGEFDFDRDFFVTFFLGKKVKGKSP
jgi:hypothetical protein